MMPPDNTGAGPNPPRAQENRRLKIVGVALMCASLPALVFLTDQVESGVLRSADARRMAFLALLYLVAVNIFTLGLIILLAGVKNVSLNTNEQARGGAWARLAGANLLWLCGGFAALHDSGAFNALWEELWFGPLVLVLFVYMARTGVVLFRKGWKYEALPAERLLQEDARAPVVYIRSFKDDSKFLLNPGLARWRSVMMWTVAVTAEQELAAIMNRVGPVVAIGQPGELLPELGAARLYVSDDDWKNTITDLMRRSSLVVIRAGTTANLRWEVDQAVELLPRRQLLFVSFERGDDGRAFDEEIEQRFGRPKVAARPPAHFLLRWLWAWQMHPNRVGKIVYFDENSNPCVEPVGGSFSWAGLFLSPVRPFWGPLVGSFRRVFGRLGLPWVEQKSKTAAVLLAAAFGMFGLHHFYLGNRRRGFYYLAFFWTLVPMLLSWTEAIKYLLADRQDFERKFSQHGRPELKG